MLADERYLMILERLKVKPVVRTQELIDDLGVSRETIRRDLKRLEEKGLVRRVYGGIASVRRALDEPPYTTREVVNTLEKQAIGRAAAALIQDGEVVILDGGTTVIEVARRIADRSNLTVITNSLRTASELASRTSHRLYMLGGEVRSGDVTTSGFMSEEGIKDFHADKAIIGAGGISPEEGVSDYYEPEARLRRQMVRRANQVIVVADHTKLGVVAFVNSCAIDAVDVCVTDAGADDRIVRRFQEKGVKVILADPNDA